MTAFFIVQHSLSGEGFGVHGHDERGAFTIHHVSFATLIGEQMRLTATMIWPMWAVISSGTRLMGWSR